MSILRAFHLTIVRLLFIPYFLSQLGWKPLTPYLGLAFDVDRRVLANVEPRPSLFGVDPSLLNDSIYVVRAAIEA